MNLFSGGISIRVGTFFCVSKIFGFTFGSDVANGNKLGNFLNITV